MKYIILFFMTFHVAIALDQGFIYKAQNYYDNGEFSKAISLYNKNNFSKLKSGKLYYNMGNFYYRNNEFVKSYYYLNEAKKISPRNPDLNFNISYVKKKFEHNLIIDKPAYLLQNYLSNHEILFIMLLFLIILLTFNLFQRKFHYLKYFRNVSLVMFLCFSLLFIMRFSIGSRRNAIILNKVVNIYSGPSQKNVILFKVFKGNILDIVSIQKNWLKVKLGNRQKGWVNIKNTFYNRNF